MKVWWSSGRSAFQSLEFWTFERLNAYKIGAASITPSNVASVEFHLIWTSGGMAYMVDLIFFLSWRSLMANCQHLLYSDRHFKHWARSQYYVFRSSTVQMFSHSPTLDTQIEEHTFHNADRALCCSPLTFWTSWEMLTCVSGTTGTSRPSRIAWSGAKSSPVGTSSLSSLSSTVLMSSKTSNVFLSPTTVSSDHLSPVVPSMIV